MKQLDSITDSKDLSLSKLWETVKDGEARRAAVHGFADSDMTYQVNNNNRYVKWMSEWIFFIL